MKRKIAASAVQVAGMLTVSAAVGLVSVWGGLLTLGAGALLFGVALERSS